MRLWSGSPGLGAWDVGTTELLLTWIEWVEVEVRGIDHFEEELRRLRGAVMVAAVAGRVV